MVFFKLTKYVYDNYFKFICFCKRDDLLAKEFQRVENYFRTYMIFYFIVMTVFLTTYYKTNIKKRTKMSTDKSRKLKKNVLNIEKQYCLIHDDIVEIKKKYNSLLNILDQKFLKKYDKDIKINNQEQKNNKKQEIICGPDKFDEFIDIELN